MNGIIRTDNLLVNVPAMLSTSGNVVNPVRRIGMFILTPKKQCTKCGEWKDKSEFPDRGGKRKGELHSYCKECMRSYTKKHYQDNKEEYKERHSQYQKDNRESARARVRKWYWKNIERARELARQYHQNNRDVNLEKNRQWWKKNAGRRQEYYKEHKERWVAYDNNRRAKKNGGKISAAEWRAIKEKHGNKCIVPGCDRTDITMDHVIPLALGGTHTVDNVQPLCLFHNLSKGTKVVDYR
jgi:hypothetical protein